jgi:hypothetical protein
MSNTSSSDIRKHLKLNRDEIEKRLLERFPILNNERILHSYFSSYDFHENEKDMVIFWRDVLYFIYESVKDAFALKIDDLIDITRIKNKRPLCLQNILISLINCGEYLLLSDLNSEDYYRKNYPQIYGKETWSSWVKKGLINGLNYWKKNNDDIIKHNEVIINKKLFLEHLDIIVNIIKDMYHHEDISVITVQELKSKLSNNQYLDICLSYLSKIKRLASFKVKVDNNELDCIKLLVEDEQVSEKDYATVTITMQINKLDRKIEEISKIINECIDSAKDQMRKNNRNAAGNILKKKNVYLKTYDKYNAMKLTLEQNLLDIKSMESTKGVKKVLEEAVIATQSLAVDINQFESLTDKMRDNSDRIAETNDVIDKSNKEIMDVNIIKIG